METPHNLQLAVPFFMVANMEAALEFYTKGLQFTITNKWIPGEKIEWCWLQRENVAFMLQQPRNKNYFEDKGKPGSCISICVICKDALTLYHEFISRGIVMPEPFVGNNMWVVSVTDPDGYQLHFESQTDVPEETKYSEVFK